RLWSRPRSSVPTRSSARALWCAVRSCCPARRSRPARSSRTRSTVMGTASSGAGSMPADASGWAPGRVNLIGEHTDYNGGFVLPMAIPQRTHVVLRKTGRRRIHARSEEMAEAAEFALGEETKRGGWADYVAGVTWVLAQGGFPVEG